MLRPLKSLIFLIATACCSTLTAQSHTDWPAPTSHPELGPIEVLTVTAPGILHHCRVHSITTDSITCGVGLARRPVVYQRDNIAALIFAPDHSGEHLFVACISVVVAGTVVAAIFLPPLAAVAIGIPSIFLGLFSVMATDGDHNDEAILYQRPKTPLTIHLRTR
jgi:hypothetical protein